MIGVDPGRTGLVRSPYRASPLGAHVDHQGGVVTGMALDRCLLLAFAPRQDGRFVLSSRQFGGPVEVPIDDVPPQPLRDWADYGRGAVCALRAAGHELQTGATVLVDGYTDCGGLSTSAATGVAYLLALEQVNGLNVDARENIDLDRRIENDYIGLSNGILDQSCILLGRRDHLTVIDCAESRFEQVPLGGDAPVTMLCLFSGLRTPLSDTDYNRRVDECREAATRLLQAAALDVPDRPRFRDVPEEAWREHRNGLDEKLARRAEHYFTEQDRVRRGIEHWRAGDLAAFGRLVTESGRSSVHNYQCGNRFMRSAFEALVQAPGVLGARFSGAGFRGCCIALVEAERAEQAAQQALETYLGDHPRMADEAGFFFCRPARGAAVVETAT
jgi:galacturonokinase